MKLTFYNEVIQFDYELATLMKSSEDPMFTSYLGEIKNDIQTNPGRTPEYRQQVINNYCLYADKMNNLGCPVERFFFKAVYGEMEAPEIKNTIFANPAPAAVPQPEASEQAEASAVQPEVTAQPEVSVQPKNEAPVQPVSQPAAFDPYTGKTLIQAVQPAKTASSDVSKKTEFAVGAIVMSIIGSVFLLTGLVYFSINFLDSFAQGMVMYLVCAIILCVSEFVIRKLVPRLSAVFTAIGLSGVFLTTVVNYKSLENLNLPVAAVILGICAVLVCIFGYIRKSQLYSIIGFLAAFISSIAIASRVSPTEYIVITLCTLIISSLWLIFPVEKYNASITPVMLFAEMIYMMVCAFTPINCASDLTVKVLRLIFVICSLIVINFIYFMHAKRSKSGSIANDVIDVFNYIIYSVAVLFFAGACSMSPKTLPGFSEAEVIVVEIILYLIAVIIEGVFAFLLRERKDRHFYLFYIGTQVTGLILLLSVDFYLVKAVLLICHCLLSRYMTRFENDKRVYKITDLVLQVFVMFYAIGISSDTYHEPIDYVGYVLLIIGLVACIFIGTGFLNIIQIFSVFAITFVLFKFVNFLPDGLGEVIGIGVILLFTYLINSIPRIKGRHNYVFNWFAFIWSMILLIPASRTGDSIEDVLIFSIGAVFGLTLIILLMNKEYRMPFRGKYIMIPAYLTFISFLVPLEKGFILSIILMAIALISVIIGFALKEKSIRIYGLILSIVICAKIALIDFISIGDVMAKTIMYIFVGALALAIGCIYMVLESRESKAAKLAAGAQAQPQFVQPQQFVQAQPGEQTVTATTPDPQPVVNESIEGNLGNNETL
ncbi:MAG: hypothetical protein K6F65_01625 [Lachnospiraceae bacterium]|nr:hypothetical protein [Lachnospiraceae bacterium]